MTRLLPLKYPADFDAVRTPSDRKFVLRCIARLRNDPFYGGRLDNRSSEGGDAYNFGGLRRLKLGRYRVVYRVLPDEMEPWYVEVIAIGHRRDVYATVARRLEGKRAA